MIHLKDFWRTIRRTLTVFILGTTVAVFTCQAINPPFVIKHLGDGQSIVQIDEQKKFFAAAGGRGFSGGKIVYDSRQ